MTFEEILNQEISDSFKIKSPNLKKGHPWHLSHLHADFVELKSLFWSKNEWLTLQNVIDHYKDINEIPENKESSTDEVGSDASDIEDRLFTRGIEIFEVLKDRFEYFGNDYPFDIDSTNNYIKLKTEITERHLLYIKLLLASNLNNFSKFKTVLTNDFEKISAYVLKSFLPKSIVKEFGKNSTYKGNTRKKIKKLSKELNVDRRKKEIRKISRTASQEKGLDLIAYIPFQDKITSMVILLAQCACGKSWPSKTNETNNYESYLDFLKLKPIHSMIVPYSLSGNKESGFYQSESLNGKLVFERKRILELLTNLEFFRELKSYELAKKVSETVAVEV